MKVFGADHTLSFPEFLDKVSSSDTTTAGEKKTKVPQNVHWRPQADICQIGLLWPYYNVHGNFEDIQSHSRRLLQRAGLWKEFGRSGWGGQDEDGIAMFQVRYFDLD